MLPPLLTARSAAERYVGELVAGCEAIANIFDVRSSAAPANQDTGCHNPGVVASDEPDPNLVTSWLAKTKPDPRLLSAWLRGFDVPKGLVMSQVPLATSPWPSRKPNQEEIGADETLRGVDLPKGWVTSEVNLVTSPWPAREPSQGETGPGEEFDDVGGRYPNPDNSSGFSDIVSIVGAAEVDSQRLDADSRLLYGASDTLKPTLTGDARESETVRLRRLLDPRHRRYARPHAEQPTQAEAQSCGRTCDGSVSLKSDAPAVNNNKDYPAFKTKHEHGPPQASLAVPVLEDDASSRRTSIVPGAKRVSASDASGKKLFMDLRTMSKSGLRSSKVSLAPLPGKAVPPPAGFKARPRRSLSFRQRSLPGSHDHRIDTFTQWRKSTVTVRKEPSEPSKQSVEEQLDDFFPQFKHDFLYLYKELASSHDQSAIKSAIRDDAERGFELASLAVELHMSVTDVSLVRSVFDSFDMDVKGKLDIEEFENAVTKILQLQLRDSTVTADRVKNMSDWHWWDADKNNTGFIDFKEFMTWFASNGFREDLLLTEEQRELRMLAKRHNVSPLYVEDIKQTFDSFDLDRSGTVEYSEFKEVLCKCMKVPQNCDIPETRMAYFWNEIDTDGTDGKITFCEFFCFWLRYFDPKSNTLAMPFENFYKQVRQIGSSRPDPPAYPPKGNYEEDDDLKAVGENSFGVTIPNIVAGSRRGSSSSFLRA